MNDESSLIDPVTAGIQHLRTNLLPPTHRQFEAFQSAYCYFNNTLFEGTLTPCLLIFSGRSKTGYFVPNRWRDDAGNELHEIGLNPTLLDTANLEAVMAVLVHNMVHQWQWEQSSKSGQRKAAVHYHDKEWAMKLASLGLAPSDTGEEEGKRTGFIMSQYIVKDGDFIRAFQQMPPESLLPYKANRLPFAIPKKPSKLAYECSNAECEKKVWGASNIQIKCGCGQGDYDFLPNPKDL
ncbi:MAG: SprT-like domain-containing protein [Cyanobacteria bacterium P01_A01_bin.17]